MSIRWKVFDGEGSKNLWQFIIKNKEINMNNRTRTTDALKSLNKLKVKSLKLLRREIENEDKLIAIQASYSILSLLREYE